MRTYSEEPCKRESTWKIGCLVKQRLPGLQAAGRAHPPASERVEEAQGRRGGVPAERGGGAAGGRGGRAGDAGRGPGGTGSWWDSPPFAGGGVGRRGGARGGVRGGARRRVRGDLEHVPRLPRRAREGAHGGEVHLRRARGERGGPRQAGGLAAQGGAPGPLRRAEGPGGDDGGPCVPGGPGGVRHLGVRGRGPRLGGPRTVRPVSRWVGDVISSFGARSLAALMVLE